MNEDVGGLAFVIARSFVRFPVAGGSRRYNNSFKQCIDSSFRVKEISKLMTEKLYLAQVNLKSSKFG